MRVLIAILVLISLCFPPGLLNAEQSSWQLRKNQEGIPVYTRKVAGSPILEVKANVIIDAPLPKVIAYFEDEKQIRRWYYQCVLSKFIENDGPKQEVIYLILHLPWPVAARDFVFKRTRSKDATHGSIIYTLTALPNRLPLVKGMIRVKSIESVWSFKSLPRGQTEMFCQQHTDNAGSIPDSFVNAVVADTPYYSLKNFRELLTGKDVGHKRRIS
jgi:hypothetical protein